MRAITLILIVLSGCRSLSSVQGGQARHETGAMKISYNGVTIYDSRELVATTQPSVSTSGSNTNFSHDTQTDEGVLGGFDFQTKDVAKSPTAWGLIGILLVAAFFFYFIHNWVGVIVCVAGVVIAFIYPMALVWIALSAIVFALWSSRAVIVELIRGSKKAIDVIPPTEAEVVKSELEKAQSPATKTVVATVKAGL